MTRTLPPFIDLRRDQLSGSWLLICRACGIKEHYHSFWLASRAAHDHADAELADEDEKRSGA